MHTKDVTYHRTKKWWEADRARDNTAPTRARWYPLFATIASLWMQSNDGGRADSPTLSENESGNATSNQNRQMATSM